MDYKEVRKLLTEHFTGLLHSKRAQIDRHGPLTQDELDILNTSIAVAQDGIKNKSDILAISTDDIAKSFLAKYNIADQNNNNSIRLIKTDIPHAYVKYAQEVIDYNTSSHEYNLDSKKIDDHYVSHNEKTTVAPQARTVLDLIQMYTAEHHQMEQWAAKTKIEKEDHLNLLIEYLGNDKIANTLNKDDARNIKLLLLKYPKNRNKNAHTKSLTLQDILLGKTNNQINFQTANKYLQTYSAFMNWTTQNGYTSINPFDGQTIPKPKSHDNEGRSAFDRDQIINIIKHIVNAEYKSNYQYRKWGTLIAIYSGARLNEISQLRITDIRCEDNINYIDLNTDDDNKSLKSQAARRKIPIHPELENLGLLSFVEQMRATGAARLFPTLSYTAQNGYGRNLGRWFNETLLIELGYNDQRLSFHSLRHSFVTALGQAGIIEEQIQELVGHKRQTVTKKHYFRDGHTLSQLLGYINSISYSI